MRTLLLTILLSLLGGFAKAQVSVVTRNQDAYRSIKYAGIRILNINEANIEGREENVFLFSKSAKNVMPDTMYLQRFTKEKDKWVAKATYPIMHNGIIFNWDARKGFFDEDKDGSVDAYFFYSLADANQKQQSVHLLFSKGKEFYSISGNASDNYQTPAYSKNFASLSQSIKDELIKAWENVDKD